MDAIWAGVIGTIAGGVVGSATSLLSPLVLWRTESRKLDVEHANAKERLALEHQQQAAEAARTHKLEMVTAWRAGVAEYYVQDRAYREDGTGDVPPPEILGSVWFESLRPHLPPTMDTSSIDRGNLTEDGTRALSLRIGELEREWKLV